jgi:hypothetical protein
MRLRFWWCYEACTLSIENNAARTDAHYAGGREEMRPIALTDVASGTTRTIRDVRYLVAMGRKADVTQTSSTPQVRSDKPSFSRTISCG